MTQATIRFRTIEEFLGYDDGTDTRYELVDGVLVEMGAESTLNTRIAVFLLLTFARLGVADDRLGMKQLIAVSNSKATARDPDLIVHSEASARAIDGQPQACLAFDAPAPVLVVEVVSPGEPGSDNYDRDYVEKPKEYAARGIDEFWRVDPGRAVVTVLRLENGSYQAQDFRSGDSVASRAFPDLRLTAEQILRAGR